MFQGKAFSNLKISSLMFVLVIIIVTISLIGTSPVFFSTGYDREVFRYISTLVRLGYEPYTYAFDHKPPMLYLLAAPFTCLGVWGYWLFFWLSNVLILFGALLLTHEKKYLWAPILLFQLVFTNTTILEGGGLTRQITTLFLVAANTMAINACISINKKPQPRLLLLYGCLVGLIFWTQQNEVLSTFPSMAVIFLTSWYAAFNIEKRFIRSGLFVCSNIFAGFAGITLFVLSYFYFKGGFVAISEMLNQAFLVNTKVYTNSLSFYNIYLNTAKIWQAASSLSLTPSILISTIPLVFIFFRKKSALKYLCLFSVLGFLVQSITASFSGRIYGHYFLPFSAWIFSAIYVFEVLHDKPQNRWVRFLPKAAFYCAILFTPFIKYSLTETIDKTTIFARKISEQGLRNTLFQHSTYERAVGPFREPMANLSKTFGQLYIIEATNLLAINSDLNIPAPTKFIYHHFWANSNFRSTFGEPVQILKSLENQKTTVILDCRQNNIFINSEVDSELNRLLERRYFKEQSIHQCSKFIRIN